MTDTHTINGFLELLGRSNLLTEDQLRRAVNQFELNQCRSGREAANRLVQARVITPFQAERLLDGRYRGFVIDRYKVREILGVGGMGCIYIAEDTQEKEKVALKLLTSQHEVDNGMLMRLKLEARAGILLDHPNIVKTHRLGSTGAVTFMVMELVRGVSLHELVAMNGPVASGFACAMIRDAALGLHAAHDRRIIHRDVKPANILIDHDGRAKILDFGLALIQDDADDEFSLAMIFGHDCLGTPDFISPEQSLNSGEADARSDIYSLGATFYLALTGKVPFPEGSTREKLAGHRSGNAVPASERNPDVPAAVSEIVSRMMAKEPSERFASAADVAAALEPHVVSQRIHFDFRKIITLRARLARQRRDQRGEGRPSRTSSLITGSSAFWGASGASLEAEIDTPLAGQADTQITAEPASPKPEPPPKQAPRPSAPVPSGWRLRRLTGGRQIPLRSGRLVIGRDGDCDVPLLAKGVSGKHCELTWSHGHWTVHDLGSESGTAVNGTAIERTVMKSGDQIRLGAQETLQLLGPGSDGTDSASPTRTLWVPVVVGSLTLIAFALWYLLGR